MTRVTVAQAMAVAVGHHQAGRIDRAAEVYRQVLALHPEHPEALHLLGTAELQQGRAECAVELISRAAALTPGVAHVQSNLGEALRAAKRLDRAEVALREAVRLDPTTAAYRDNLGLLLEEQSRYGAAVAAYRDAVALAPHNADFHVHLARAMFKAGAFEASVDAARHALAIEPGNILALTIGGSALETLGKPSAALEWLDAALARDAASSAAWVYVARALTQLARHGEALAAHDRAVAADPANSSLRTARLIVLHYVPELSAEHVADAHRDWARVYADPHSPEALGRPRSRDPHRRLRVGYVSGDFRRHAVAFFVLPLLESHDRTRFEIFGYTTGERGDEITDQIRSACAQWRDISRLDDDAAAAQVRADGIDVLVDLAGHTAGNRLGVFARRSAPVQVTYCGYPGTTGMRAMDFRITDAIADPPGMTDHLHSERLVRLPETFLCYAPPPAAPPVAPLPFDATGHVTFGSFSRPAKIATGVIDAWCRVLNRVPTARLVFKAAGLDEPATRDRWLERFASQGIAADRISLHEPTPSYREHLARVGSVDIALDTFPYNGTTTTCEAMWMGVPVVTLAGQTHVSRVGASLLHAVGLDNLVGTTADEYVDKAVALARDTSRVREMRQNLRETMRWSPLADAQRLARQIEEAYFTMSSET